MTKNLVIVESPAKAKTIQKYLGAGFEVLSSVGHIRSIAKKNKDGSDAINVKDGFATTYQIDPEKKKVIAELKKAAKAADTVWLATDEDREGEAIAWHLCEVLSLDPLTTKRIVFHEITKSAIEEAIKNPRSVDMNLVKAQQARQILDRLVGFELSPVVWQKVPGGKSAGRVQSPAVRLLVEREREIKAFAGSSSFKLSAEFSDGKETFKAELPLKFSAEEEAKSFLLSLSSAQFKVSGVVKSPGTRNPGAPFTTSTLQQEANSRLGFGAKATMSAAQKLYQEGKITYMRTDSVNLSKQALAQMSDFITKTYGKNYHQFRTYKTKSSSAQEAHEAIRPTDFSVELASSDSYAQKLYELIRARTLASQMAPAKLEKTTISISISNHQELFEAKGEVIIFDGFLKVYGANKKEDAILPAVKEGDALSLNEASARQVFARPPARYTEGSLVKKLEELGIGRPSTYATIINTVQERGYALKGESEGTERDVISLKLKGAEVEREILQEKTGSQRGKLVPTAAGEVVSDFLTGYFDQIVDYGFTSNVEQEFDDIAGGKLERNKMLERFYTPFHQLIENSGEIKRSDVAQAREVGVDPKTGKTVFARFGRFGPMLQLGDSEDENEKPRFAPLPSGSDINTVTLDQALEMFKLPKALGDFEGGEVKVSIGRFGPYIQHDGKYVSIKGKDVHLITLEEAIEEIKLKREADKDKFIADWGDVQILRGPYGIYIKGVKLKKNAKIPKDLKPEDITEEQARKLLDEAPERKARGRFARKTSSAKTTKKPTKKATVKKPAKKK